MLCSTLPEKLFLWLPNRCSWRLCLSASTPNSTTWLHGGMQCMAHAAAYNAWRMLQPAMHGACCSLQCMAHAAACNARRMLQRACMAHAAACKQMSHTYKAAGCQSTSGLLVAPTSSTLLSALLGSQPSICTSISVFSRRLASCSPVTPHAHCNTIYPL